ncbi:MAG: hypothetical protein ACKV2O_00700 [Acidimicrobiales bacterium]
MRPSLPVRHFDGFNERISLFELLAGLGWFPVAGDDHVSDAEVCQVRFKWCVPSGRDPR